MTSKDNRLEKAAELRRRAEEVAREKTARSPGNIKAISPEETQQTLHELRVYQIELEMQNEHLRQTQVELAASRERYFALYDLAPLGYCILSEQGLILEANLTVATLLGVDKGALVKQPITRFILKEDQDIYYLHRKHLFESGEPHASELRMVKKDGTAFWTHLAATVTQDPEGRPVCRVVLSDITERKRSEEQIVHLASFPELNPDPVSEFAADGSVIYTNAVTRHLFPDVEALGAQHPFLIEWEVVVSQLKNKPVDHMAREVRVGEGYYLQTVQYIEARNSFRIYARDITDRKRAEEAIRQSEERHRTILQTAMDGFWLSDMDGRILEVNNTYCRMSGYSAQELLTMRITDLEAVETASNVASHIRNVREKGEDRFESRHRRKDGSLYDVEVSAQYQPCEGGQFVSFFRDITERKIVEGQLLRKSTFLEALLSSSFDGIMVVDAAGQKIFQNQRVAELWKIPQYIMDISDDSQQVEYVMGKTKNPQQFYEKVNYLYSHPDETSRDEVELTDGTVLERFSSPVMCKDGAHFGRIWVFHDITSLKRAEAEKLQLRDKAEMSSRLAAVGEMAAGIAHEINNPLTSVIGYSELLLEQNLPPDVKEQLQIIADGSHRVKNIVRRMLTFARQNKPVKTSANINDLIDNTLGIRSYVLRTANIEVIRDFDPDLPCVTADPGQLQQVFLNLIVNAEFAMKKAHDKGNLTITTEAKDGHIRISFRDNGPGMSPETIKKVFNPFFTTKDPGEGTGLGLSLSRSIILEHNGTIEVESEPGKGANFIITLPVTPKEEAISETTDNAAAPPEKVRAARILVVDDEYAIRSLVSKILTTSGHTVDTTGDPDVVLLKLENTSYDIVLTDVRMPGMSGMELYGKITEKHPELARKVIFITGDTSDLNIIDYLNQHDLPYITKPFNRETLLKQVNRLL